MNNGKLVWLSKTEYRKLTNNINGYLLLLNPIRTGKVYILEFISSNIKLLNIFSVFSVTIILGQNQFRQGCGVIQTEW